MLREVKPKTARSARALAKRAPLVTENTKKTLFLRSTSSSSLANTLLTDIYSLKRPLAVRFTKKNTIHPFEDPSSLEFFSEKNDTSLICLASHSKKRPHCLTFIRCFGGKILDLMEFMVSPDNARSLGQFGGAKCRVGTKPLLSFSGTPFEAATTGESAYAKFAQAKSLFMDFFRGEEAKEIDAEGLQMMISFVAVEDRSVSGDEAGGHIAMRVWRIRTRRAGQKLPRVDVEEMGPRVDFRLGRVRAADDDMKKASLQRRSEIETRTKKNVGTDPMGDKIGRVHLGRQDLNDLQTRKIKGLKRVRGFSESSEEDEGHDTELEMAEKSSSDIDEADGESDSANKRQRLT